MHGIFGEQRHLKPPNPPKVRTEVPFHSVVYPLKPTPD